MKSAENVFKEMAAHALDLQDFHKDLKGFLVGKIRQAHADAMRAMSVVVEGTLCGVNTTVPEFRESVMSRIEACVDAVENGTTVPDSVKFGLPPATPEEDK